MSWFVLYAFIYFFLSCSSVLLFHFIYNICVHLADTFTLSDYKYIFNQFMRSLETHDFGC